MVSAENIYVGLIRRAMLNSEVDEMKVSMKLDTFGRVPLWKAEIQGLDVESIGATLEEALSDLCGLLMCGEVECDCEKCS